MEGGFREDIDVTLYFVQKMVLRIEMDLRMILMGKFRLVFSILDFAGLKKIVIYVCLFSKQVKFKPNYRHVY